MGLCVPKDCLWWIVQSYGILLNFGNPFQYHQQIWPSVKSSSSHPGLVLLWLGWSRVDFVSHDFFQIWLGWSQATNQKPWLWLSCNLRSTRVDLNIYIFFFESDFLFCVCTTWNHTTTIAASACRSNVWWLLLHQMLYVGLKHIGTFLHLLHLDYQIAVHRYTPLLLHPLIQPHLILL